MSYDQQVASFYVCEKCGHIFNWKVTQHLPNGTRKDGSRICPRCGVDYVRKFRESDLDNILAQIPDDPFVVESTTSVGAM